ncbi:hypothetical protein [Nannocystis punicea]|uniref:Secreted protein n=1 Tax=Nannocystis punicea TaxID=2995304 RepID=A0ABY7GUH1_9BACT|nr:hypothetical protein [Nannocystis poenicansa]WAS90615.1 hypothetical protein O0S08_30885 [Nannocystis poenicansa]
MAKSYGIRSIIVGLALAFTSGGVILGSCDESRAHQVLQCIHVSSFPNYEDCHDAGAVPSTCAMTTCPEGYVLTGGGGSCAAGDRKLKALYPTDAGGFGIMCEQQGVGPIATAICCKL